MATLLDKIQEVKNELEDFDNKLIYYSELYYSDNEVTDEEQKKLDEIKADIKKLEVELEKREKKIISTIKKRTDSGLNLIEELEIRCKDGKLKTIPLQKLKNYSTIILKISQKMKAVGVLDPKAQKVVNNLNTWNKKIQKQISTQKKYENKLKEASELILELKQVVIESNLKSSTLSELKTYQKKANSMTTDLSFDRLMTKEEETLVNQINNQRESIDREINKKSQTTAIAIKTVNNSAQVALNDTVNKEEAKVIYPNSLKKYMKNRLIKMSESTKSAITDVVANIGSQKDEKDMSSYKGSIFYKALVEGFISYTGAVVKHPAAKMAFALSKVFIMAIEPLFLKNAKSSPPTNLKAFEADWRNIYTDMERESYIISSLHAIWRKNDFKDPTKMETDYQKVIDNLSINKAAIRKIITTAWIKASKDGIDRNLNTEFNAKAGFLEITTHVNFSKDISTGALQSISWTDTIIQLNDVDKIQGVKKSLANLGITPSSGQDEKLALSTLDLETCVNVIIGSVIKCNSEAETANRNNSILAADIGVKGKTFFLIRRKNGNWEISPQGNKMLEPFLESFKTRVYKLLKIKDIAAI